MAHGAWRMAHDAMMRHTARQTVATSIFRTASVWWHKKTYSKRQIAQGQGSTYWTDSGALQSPQTLFVSLSLSHCNSDRSISQFDQITLNHLPFTPEYSIPSFFLFGFWRPPPTSSLQTAMLTISWINDSASLVWLTYIKSCWRPFWNFVKRDGEKKDQYISAEACWSGSASNLPGRRGKGQVSLFCLLAPEGAIGLMVP